MSKLIVANWKMNPDSLGRAVSLAKKIDAGIQKKKNIEVVIAPPFPYLSDVRRQISEIRYQKSDIRHPKSDIRLGAQDTFWENAGAYTGEVSPMMLKYLGVEYVIIGHSERRKFLHETDEMIHKKVFVSLKAGLKVILCVGEPLAVRKKGLAAAKNFVKDQLKKDLKGVKSQESRVKNLIIAYEPIWAIGTGKSDKPADAAEMIKFIKSQIPDTRYQIPVLYGGSVTFQNAKSFVFCKGIDGALVGGASLKAEEFKKIIQISSQNNG